MADQEGPKQCPQRSDHGSNQNRQRTEQNGNQQAEGNKRADAEEPEILPELPAEVFGAPEWPFGDLLKDFVGLLFDDLVWFLWTVSERLGANNAFDRAEVVGQFAEAPQIFSGPQVVGTYRDKDLFRLAELLYRGRQLRIVNWRRRVRLRLGSKVHAPKQCDAQRHAQCQGDPLGGCRQENRTISAHG